MNALGGLIADYKFRYRHKRTDSQYDIKCVIDRLEGFKKYKAAVSQERWRAKQKEKRKADRRAKKAAYRKMYSYKPVHNPYLEMYRKMHIGVDPKLLDRYKTRNIYGLYEFRHIKLPKSNYKVTAGQAWSGLTKAWKGYMITKREGKRDLMMGYASACQKFAHMLDAPVFPDFHDIGLSAEGFTNAKILKEFFEGYEGEVVE